MFFHISVLPDQSKYFMVEQSKERQQWNTSMTSAPESCIPIRYLFLPSKFQQQYYNNFNKNSFLTNGIIPNMVSGTQTTVDTTREIIECALKKLYLIQDPKLYLVECQNLLVNRIFLFCIDIQLGSLESELCGGDIGVAAPGGQQQAARKVAAISGE